jgi:hypothetical protein
MKLCFVEAKFAGAQHCTGDSLQVSAKTQALGRRLKIQLWGKITNSV